MTEDTFEKGEQTLFPSGELPCLEGIGMRGVEHLIDMKTGGGESADSACDGTMAVHDIRFHLFDDGP